MESFGCSQCSDTFSYKGNLKRHERNVHNQDYIARQKAKKEEKEILRDYKYIVEWDRGSFSP